MSPASLSLLLPPSSFPSSSSSHPFLTWRNLSCSCSIGMPKPLIQKAPIFSEGRDEDEGRLIYPDSEVFMQDFDPNLSGYYRKCIIRDQKEIKNGSIDLLSEFKEILKEEDEAIDGLSLRSDWGSDYEGGLLDESSIEGMGIKGEINWDLDWEEEEDKEEKWRKELDGFVPTSIRCGNITEETEQKMKKEKISKSERKLKVREAKRSEAEESESVTIKVPLFEELWVGEEPKFDTRL